MLSAVLLLGQITDNKKINFIRDKGRCGIANSSLFRSVSSSDSIICSEYLSHHIFYLKQLFLFAVGLDEIKKSLLISYLVILLLFS